MKAKKRQISLRFLHKILNIYANLVQSPIDRYLKRFVVNHTIQLHEIFQILFVVFVCLNSARFNNIEECIN